MRWKTELPGIALSSPVIWGKRVFVTTVVSEAADDTFRTGLYGDVDSIVDQTEHSWQVWALDLHSGEVAWKQVASQGKPKVGRHLKSSHANPTPVTDGEHLVVSFGSQGLYCYDLGGKLLWQRDLGVLRSGWFYDPSYEWGFSSSPILHQGKVIVQVDVQDGSFVAAFDVRTGEPIWRTERDEIPTWGTPAILPGRNGQPDEVVTNGPTIRGYNAATGEELWTLGPNAEVTVATPVIAGGLALVAANYPPARPIYAIRPGGRGDLTLAEGETSSDQIAWSHPRGGVYIPTPIAYDGVVYALNMNGRLSAYDLESGERIYRERVGQSDSFSGSSIAADGRLYFTTETGTTYVVRAGEPFELLATNEIDGVVMSTPALSDGVLVIRALGAVWGLGEAPAGDSGD
jgi:outer membrane protein assembly factor BamB